MNEPLTNSSIVKAIVDAAPLHLESVIDQFESFHNSEENFMTTDPVEMRILFLAKMANEKNWKRKDKRGCDTAHGEAYGVPIGSWERCYDCTPLDDELRCYVISNKEDTQILHIRFAGE